MEFAESHGLKSGDDVENEVLHRDHVEKLRRQAELLQEEESSSDDSDNEHEDGTEDMVEDSENEGIRVTATDAEQPHFSGAGLDGAGHHGAPEERDDGPTHNIPSAPPRTADTLPDAFSFSSSSSNNATAGGAENPTNGPSAGGGDTLHPETAQSPRHQSHGRWKSVEDISMEEDINSLSVLELKQILAANFIDYRGCCEKTELISKVTMLYQSQQAEKSVEVKPDRDVCKICMDRTIDCVFLDCAHLVACTKCGKQLSECPICRAYIVRVVHIFRA